MAKKYEKSQKHLQALKKLLISPEEEKQLKQINKEVTK